MLNMFAESMKIKKDSKHIYFRLWFQSNVVTNTRGVLMSSPGKHRIINWQVECVSCTFSNFRHDDVIKWKHFFIFICTWTNGWVNNRDAGDLRRRRTDYDVTIMRTMENNVNYWYTGFPLERMHLIRKRAHYFFYNSAVFCNVFLACFPRSLRH